MVHHYLRTPGLLEPKTDPVTRPMKALARPMILIVTAQELRKYSDSPLCQQTIDVSIAEIRNDFLKPEFRCLLETVGPNGEFLDNLDGRCVNPGHSIEAAWFILEEARLTGGNPELIKLATTILDWSLDLGWDQEHGGILYFRDAKGLPCTEYWHDMKFWWPHNEAIIATLLAYQMTGDPKYARWHETIHNWSYSHFADLEHGEWYGYLHRDGSISTRVKGTMYKGFFHLPRMQWCCWQRVNEMLA
jgi:N-acylglucosamine 2-epimerase